MKFEIFQSKRNKKFYFNLKSRNGQVVLTSQGYTNKASCKKGATAVQKNCNVDKCWNVKTSRNGKFSFNLVSKNNEVVATSQMYKSKATLVKGMKAAKRVASNAVMVDMTTVVPVKSTASKTSTKRAKATRAKATTTRKKSTTTKASTAKKKSTSPKASTTRKKSTTVKGSTAKKKSTTAKASTSKKKSTTTKASTTRKNSTPKASAKKTVAKASTKRTAARKRKTTAKKK